VISTEESSEGGATRWLGTMLPFTGYYIDTATGVMSFMIDSSCSPGTDEGICLTREFDPRYSQVEKFIFKVIGHATVLHKCETFNF